jgi:hypothetical protein
MNFYDAIESLVESGFMDVFLPFMLIFVIVFAVLQKSHILGKDEEKRKYNVILALVMGLSVVIPHVIGRYPVGSDPVLIINNVLPNISLIMLGVISFLLIIGVFGANIKIGNTNMTSIIVIFSAIAVISTFGVAAGWFGDLPVWLRFLEDESTQMMFVTILIMGIIISFITSPPKKEKKNNFFKDMLEAASK